jgi:hypothetical protein
LEEDDEEGADKIKKEKPKKQIQQPSQPVGLEVSYFCCKFMEISCLGEKNSKI